MSEQGTKQFDLEALAAAVEKRPVPESCEEIERLFSSLPLKSSLSSPPPTPEQKTAFAMLQEKAKDPTPEEVLYMAEICSDRHHRIRYENRFWPQWETAERLYKQYYELTGSEEIKYVLDNFEQFKKLCISSALKRCRKDDFELHWKGTSPSTSRDPDSDEWKK